MIKAIIFDCFGVLTESTLNAFYDQYFNNTPEKVEAAHQLDHAANQGRITLADFTAGLAEMAGISVRETSEFLSEFHTNKDLFEYITSHLAQPYKIGFLSNVADNLLDRLFTEQEQALFDDIVLSYEVGVAKPDEAIFKLAAERLSVLPEECIFVDDVEKYCIGAEKAGMKAIVYTNFNDFKTKLEAML